MLELGNLKELQNYRESKFNGNVKRFPSELNILMDLYIRQQMKVKYAA